MREKIKKISKYTMNILAMINALIIGLSPIWNWHLDKITDTIAVLIGVIGLYLVGGKIFEIGIEEQTTFNTDELTGDEEDEI